MREKLASCHGLILGVTPWTRTCWQPAPQLRAVAKYGVGLDNIDLAACAARGVKVSRTVGANSNAVADYALTLMLAVARKAALIDRRCRERDWGKITRHRPVRQDPGHCGAGGHRQMRGPAGARF